MQSRFIAAYTREFDAIMYYVQLRLPFGPFYKR